MVKDRLRQRNYYIGDTDYNSALEEFKDANGISGEVGISAVTFKKIFDGEGTEWKRSVAVTTPNNVSVISENEKTDAEIMKLIFGQDGLSFYNNPYANDKYNASKTSKDMVTITVPRWKFNHSTNEKVASTLRYTIHKNIAEQVKIIFQEIFDDPEQFPILLPGVEQGNLGIIDWGGGYNHRHFGSENILSSHAYGLAIDINVQYNPFYSPRPSNNDFTNTKLSVGSRYNQNDVYCITTSSSIYKIFKKYGWYWGGDWDSSADFMHFSMVNH